MAKARAEAEAEAAGQAGPNTSISTSTSPSPSISTSTSISTSNSSTSSSTSNSSTPILCSVKKILFSLLFLLPFLAVAWLGGSLFYSTIITSSSVSGKPNTVTIEDTVKDSGEDGVIVGVSDEEYDGAKGRRFLIGLLVMYVTSSLLAVLLVFITLNLVTRMVKFVFVLFILLAVFGGVLMFADEHDELFGVTLMFLAVVAVIYFFSVRNRVEFMNANLRVACGAMLSSPSVIYVAVSSLAVIFLWSICWAVAVYYYSTNDTVTEGSFHGQSYSLSQCTTYVVGQYALTNISVGSSFPPDLSNCAEIDGCTSCFCENQYVSDGACFTPTYSTFNIVLFLLCFYYVSLVLSHVVHCTSAAVTTIWWMRGRVVTEDVLDSFKKSLSRWFGPICIGSLLVPPIRTMYSAVHSTMLLLDIDLVTGRPNRSNPSAHFNKVADILHNCLNTLENSVISYNRHAFSYLVIRESEDDFMQVSQGVSELFSTRGFTSLVHANVLENILMLACMSSGILVMILANIYVAVLEHDLDGNIIEMLPVCCFVTSYLTSLLSLQIVQGATSAVCVCLAVSPDDLQTNHPQYFEPFVSAWRKAYPEANITIVCSSFATGKNKFSVDVFPKAYVPPSLPMSKMNTGSSSVSIRDGGKKKLQKYDMLSADMSDDSGSDDGEIGKVEAHDEDLDAMLRSYASSQLPNIKLFSSPGDRESVSENVDDDDDDNEFVL